MRIIPRPDADQHPVPIDAYLSTVVSIHVRDHDVVITPDEASGPTPGPASFVRAGVVHLLTAANPYSVELSDAENAERNAEAATILDARGIRYVPAVGMDAGRTWVEPGHALMDADDSDVQDLANQWCQHGIYRWDAQGWWLVLSHDGATVPLPARVHRTR